jgi:NAD(P)-dependent dehydrogenase (short-subunit alcohol dehydrogenase family)
MSKIEFKDRVAIVTGAGHGIGKSHAVELAKRGAKVVINDYGVTPDGHGSDPSVADAVVKEIKSMGGAAVPNYDNVATVEGGENIVNTAVREFGKVDILINNAGFMRDSPFFEMDEKTWDAVVDVNLKSAYNVTKPAFLNMMENKYGRIVLTSSGAGTHGLEGKANYTAAKAGLLGLSNTLRFEGAEHNILVNVVLPAGATRLLGPEKDIPEPLRERWRPEYVTPAVLYMCSEKFKETGLFINAFGLYFSRSAIVTNPGVTFKENPTPEKIMETWNDICDMKNAKIYRDCEELSSRSFSEDMG